MWPTNEVKYVLILELIKTTQNTYTVCEDHHVSIVMNSRFNHLIFSYVLSGIEMGWPLKCLYFSFFDEITKVFSDLFVDLHFYYVWLLFVWVVLMVSEMFMNIPELSHSYIPIFWLFYWEILSLRITDYFRLCLFIY